MKKLTLFIVTAILITSCGIDFEKSAQESFAHGKVATADFKSFANEIDTILLQEVKPGKINIPDSVKGMFGLQIMCVEKYLLDLVRDSSGAEMEKLYSKRDTFSWISSQKIATSIFYAMEGDSTCTRGMSDLEENYIKSGLPWILVIDAYEVHMPYVLKEEENTFMGGVFLADCYLVDYKKKKVLAYFEFEGGNSDEVRYKKKLLRDNFTKKIKEDFRKNVKKQMEEKLTAVLGQSSFPGMLVGLEEGGFFTNYSQTKELFDAVKKTGDSTLKDSIEE